MRLAHKVVVITGAGSGLGRAASRLFAQEGARVVVTDVSEDRAKQTLDLVHGDGGEAIAVKADVTVEAEVEAAVAAAVDTYGKLDVMFANAGIPAKGFGLTAFEDISEAEWDETNDVVLKGVFFAVKHAVRAMKNNPDGPAGSSIICTSSAASLVGYPGFPQYGAAKGGINAMVRICAAWEIGRYGIRINAICPTHGGSANFILPGDAPVLEKSHEEMGGEWIPEHSPIPLKLPRPPRILDNAYPALFLASDESMYMSGVCLPTTDGGTLATVAIPFGDDWRENLNENARKGDFNG
ncbi:SDR family NAD(P)-dependent oxidoreductase [Pseudonocardia sp. KRD291]|uniref:SDR family NAD(P)-dependent oxidoreductase n=1 Tax=Pseudonocardia sp. KRD291 TaxID=2792007 RepID=UPI001C4A5165|nr:SDR family NAD(P)-dependent oxidoreductase [Pseudonocardia sp. KRD291]MBW0101210.1 SDR family oxidoreductase [Pseudonocardia sp. KRD291]